MNVRTDGTIEVQPPLPATAGTYLVQFDVATPFTTTVGRAGRHHFPAGTFLYMGSARGPGGLAARLGRHLRGGPRQHWHVDYLRAQVQPVAAWTVVAAAAYECAWAAAWQAAPLVNAGPAGFGASDCHCPTHLFHLAHSPSVDQVQATARAANLPAMPVPHQITRSLARQA